MTSHRRIWHQDRLLAKDAHSSIGLAAIAMADQIGGAHQLMLLATNGGRLRRKLKITGPVHHLLDAILRLAHGFREDIDGVGCDMKDVDQTLLHLGDRIAAQHIDGNVAPFGIGHRLWLLPIVILEAFMRCILWFSSASQASVAQIISQSFSARFISLK